MFNDLGLIKWLRLQLNLRAISGCDIFVQDAVLVKIQQTLADSDSETNGVVSQELRDAPTTRGTLQKVPAMGIGIEIDVGNIDCCIHYLQKMTTMRTMHL